MAWSEKFQPGGEMRMKKTLLFFGGMALSVTFAATVFAGAIENKTNWSAEYIRTLNRNAATDYADIAAYNPAGTVKLTEGFIINGSLQYLSKEYENVVNGTSFESDEPSYIPGIFGVYNTGKWSLYGAFSNYGGGGKVDFSDGNATTVSLAAGLLGNPLCPPYSGTCTNFGAQQLSAESFYLGYTIGGAYSLNDMVSFSIGLRYIDAHREAQGSVMVWNADYTVPFTAKVDYEQDDSGFSGIFGANLSPTDKLNIGIRYEMKTSLDLKATVYEGAAILADLDTPIVNGESVSRDLPALLGLGASYQITPKLRTEVNYTYYFNEDADWSGAEETINNGYDIGISLEYRFNEKILGSIGYLHTELGVDPANFLPENPELDANTLGAGIAYAFTEKFHTNFSIGNSFYEDDSYVAPSGALIEYKKNVFFLALGLEYRFM
jgi:long-chain fatty acid transport protein